MNRNLNVGAGFKNTWWLNLPGILVLTAMIFKAVCIFPSLPGRVPMQFDLTGKPTTWGSPLGLLAAMLFPVLSMVVFNLVVYATYNGYETKKKFGWYFLFVPFFLGFYLILAWTQLDFAAACVDHYHFPWLIALLTAIILTLIAAVLEWLRPVAAHPENAADQKEQYLSQWKSHLSNRNQTGRFLYFESQNPFWSKYAITALILVFIITGFFTWKSSPVNAIIFWALAPCIALLYGGLGFMVDNRSVRVKLGILRLTLCKIKLDQIESVHVHSFSPLQDFGGWGIRISFDGTLGFFVTGNAGVLIKTKSGRKYLLGSDNPARFAGFIESLLQNK